MRMTRKLVVLAVAGLLAGLLAPAHKAEAGYLRWVDLGEAGDTRFARLHSSYGSLLANSMVVRYSPQQLRVTGPGTVEGPTPHRYATEVFDFATQTWSRVCDYWAGTSSIPDCAIPYRILGSDQMGSAGGHLYLYGGYRIPGDPNSPPPGNTIDWPNFTDFRDTWRFNGSTWNQVCGNCLPGYRAHASLAGNGTNRLVLFGGMRFRTIPAGVTWASFNWAARDTSPTSRLVANNTYEFDTSSLTWSATCTGGCASSGPAARIFGGFTWVGGTRYLLVAGAQAWDPGLSQTSPPFNDAWVYDTATNTWTAACASCPIGRRFDMAAAPWVQSDGTVSGALVAGGLREIGWSGTPPPQPGRYYTDVYRVSLGPTTWLSLPTPWSNTTINTGPAPLGFLASTGGRPVHMIAGAFPSNRAMLVSGALMNTSQIQAGNTQGLRTNTWLLRWFDTDLSIVKRASRTSWSVGQTGTVTLNWALGGAPPGSVIALSEPSTNVTVTDTLPAGFTFAGPPPAGCSIAGQTFTCALGNVAYGSSGSISFPVTATTDGDWVNVAEIRADEPDPDPRNNESEIPMPVDIGDLSITKSVNPRTVEVGAEMVFTLVVTNSGSATAQNVVVNDTVPSNLSILSVAPGSCVVSGQNVSCALGDMAVGASQTITIRVRGDQIGGFTNTATVGSDSPDRNPDNNQSSTDGTVTERPQPNLSVAKAVDRSRVPVGEEFTYTVTWRNTSPDVPATGVVVTDTLPDGITPLSVNNELCAISAQTITCTIGDLAPGTEGAVNIRVRGSRAGTFTNTAVIQADGDNDPNDNTSSVDVDIGEETPPPAPRGPLPNTGTGQLMLLLGLWLVASGLLSLNGLQVLAVRKEDLT